MAGAKEKKVKPYGFTKEFEAALVALLCSRPRLYGLVGRELDAEAFVDPAAQMAVAVCQEIAKDVGNGPNSALTVIQRIRRHMDEGKATMDEMGAVDDLIAGAEDVGLPSEEEVLADVVPTLKRRMQSDAIMIAMDVFPKKGDLSQVLGMLDRAEALGQNDNSIGTKLGGASFGLITEMKYLERCPTGVRDLDTDIGGGLPRGQLGIFVGGAGDGKSMALSHLAAHNCRNGLFVAYATLELPVPIVLARIKANHTGVPIDVIMDGSAEAQRKLLENPPPGPCYIKEFTPQVTTVSDLKAWVEECEEVERRPVDVVVCDYADKMTEKIKGVKGDLLGSYKIMEYVYERYRIWMNEDKKWGWTASQASRMSSKDKQKKVDLDNVADSINKVRVADLVITLNLDEEEMKFYVAKNRTGRSRQTVGPLPTDFAIGAVAPLEPTSPTEALARPAEDALTGTMLDDL